MKNIEPTNVPTLDFDLSYFNCKICNYINLVFKIQLPFCFLFVLDTLDVFKFINCFKYNFKRLEAVRNCYSSLLGPWTVCKCCYLAQQMASFVTNTYYIKHFAQHFGL